MVTSCVSPDCVVLLLSPEDRISPSLAVRSSLLAAGLRPWPDMKAELFDRSGQRLLIACPRPPLCLLGPSRGRLRLRRPRRS